MVVEMLGEWFIHMLALGSHLDYDAQRWVFRGDTCRAEGDKPIVLQCAQQ